MIKARITRGPMSAPCGTPEMTSACEDSSHSIAPAVFLAQEGLNPLESRTSNSIVVELAEESLVRDFVKSFGKVQQDDVNLVSSRT